MTTADHEADAAAMERLQAGDDLALNELMIRWKEPLARFLFRFTQNECDAVDLAQDTFVRVYEALSRYDARANFATWLFAIARNLCRNHARYKARHPQVSLDANVAPEGDATLADRLASETKSPAQDADTHELSLAVRAAIQSLPEDQRTATLLFEYEDFSHVEIARVLGCSAKAVENRLYRARQTLREKLIRWLG